MITRTLSRVFIASAILVLAQSSFAMGIKRPAIFKDFEKAGKPAEKAIAQIGIDTWIQKKEINEPKTHDLVMLVQSVSMSFGYGADDLMVYSRALSLTANKPLVHDIIYDSLETGLKPYRLQRVLPNNVVQVAFGIENPSKGNSPDVTKNIFSLAYLNPAVWTAAGSSAIEALDPIVETAHFQFLVLTVDPAKPDMLTLTGYANETAQPVEFSYQRSAFPK